MRTKQTKRALALRSLTRYVCVHGHFYQPPRENPWTAHVPVEPSAFPFHDWNERITAECYRPNAVARILDARRPHRPHRQQLRADQLQLRPDAARLAGEQQAPDVHAAILRGRSR